MFTEAQIKALEAPLNRKHVKSRSQAGRSLSYIEGWHAIDEANRIFGFDAWSRHTLDLERVCEPYQDAKGNWRVAYMARVRITIGEKLVRDGCGYGSGIDRDLGQAHESALKEAETDAMKRALMTFGNPFGLALYDKQQNNVEDDPPPPPPPPKMSPADEDRVIETMMIALGRASDRQDLDDWYADNKNSIGDLSPEGQDRVRKAYARTLASLRATA